MKRIPHPNQLVLDFSAPMGKVCAKCLESKPLAAFSPNTRMRCGYESYCKPCRAALKRDYREAHPERETTAKRTYYASHAEECRARSRNYTATNQEAVRTRARAARAANLEHYRTLERAHRLRHLEAHRLASRTYYWAHRDELREYHKRHRKANLHRMIDYDRRRYQEKRESIRAVQRHYDATHPEVLAARNSRRRYREAQGGKHFTAAEYRTLLATYNHTCLCCGRTDVKLTADHVLPVSKGGPNSIDNIQPLCWPCNARKKDKHIDYRPAA